MPILLSSIGILLFWAFLMLKTNFASLFLAPLTANNPWDGYIGLATQINIKELPLVFLLC